jgi:hypothetical protein
MQSSETTTVTVDIVSQEEPSGYSDMFEDIEVNGCTIRVSKSGNRRRRHLRFLNRVGNCRRCLKMICNLQKSMIGKGYYMLDWDSHLTEVGNMETDQEIQNDYCNCMLRVELAFISDNRMSLEARIHCLQQ